MQYFLLPLHLIKFWYLESLFFFLRTWKNTILFLEEDLAVGLMWKLLFVPLFHDSSFIGGILSIIFRVARILLGLFAFTLVTILLFAAAIYWFVLPVILSMGIFPKANLTVVFFGVGLFLIHTLTHPHKKVWQIKVPLDQVRNPTINFWNASSVSKRQLNYQNILKSHEVGLLLSYLETQSTNFANFQINNADKIGFAAFELAKKVGSFYIRPEHFFVATIKSDPNLEQLLLKLDLEESDFENALKFLEKRRNKWRRVWIWDEDFSIHHLKGTNRGWLGAPTPNLDFISEDITRYAAKYGVDDFVGRGKIVSEVIDVLSQDKMRNVMLVGFAGSGKTTLINFLAKQIISGNAPPSLATKRLVTLDLTKLLSGVQTQGEVAERVKAAFEDAQFYQDVIIVLEEIHNICLGEAGAAFNLNSLIIPYLDFGNFQFIGTTESENYGRILEKNGVFARLFTKIEMGSSTDKETIEILEDQAIEIERSRRVNVSFISLKKATELASKFIKDRVLPDSAISILVQSETRAASGWITARIIEDVVSTRVNVPIAEVGNVQKEQLLDLEQIIKQKFMGQELAVKAVADTLRRSAVSLREGNRPIGSFLFVGPTGVGKTELAKTISEVYFQGKRSKALDNSTNAAFLRFDMSEYQNPETLERLIGGPNDDGLLTQAVAHMPYALILLDEFEKADPRILTLFLQVLDDGRLTDYSGKTVDFTNTIIIATSNAGSLTIAKELEKGIPWEDVQKQVHDDLLQIFKPELINRFDEVVLFKSLTHEELKSIVKLRLKDLQKILKDQGYVVEFDEGVIIELAQKGYDPVLGARPLKRLIQDTLEARLSRMILEGKIKKGLLFQMKMEGSI